MFYVSRAAPGIHCELFKPMLICWSCGPARCSLRNMVVMEGHLKHCVTKAQRWEEIWPWWKGMWHLSRAMWLLSIDFRLIGISVERLLPELAFLGEPFTMWSHVHKAAMSDFSSTFTGIAHWWPPCCFQKCWWFSWFPVCYGDALQGVSARTKLSFQENCWN